MVTPLEGEASSSSQFQSLISESGYSGMLAAESSCLDSQVSATGSSLALSGWSDMCSVSPKVVVSTVGKGSGACLV